MFRLKMNIYTVKSSRLIDRFSIPVSWSRYRSTFFFEYRGSFSHAAYWAPGSAAGQWWWSQWLGIGRLVLKAGLSSLPLHRPQFIYPTAPSKDFFYSTYSDLANREHLLFLTKSIFDYQPLSDSLSYCLLKQSPIYGIWRTQFQLPLIQPRRSISLRSYVFTCSLDRHCSMGFKRPGQN